MPVYDVTHEDGRITRVISSDEKLAKKQANHQETTRRVIATIRREPPGADPSLAVSVRKIKD